MRKNITCAVAMLCALGMAGGSEAAGNSSAAPLTPCKKIPDTYLCECEKDIHVVAPEGMTLVQVERCARIEGTSNLRGSFLFKGEAAISGTIRRDLQSIDVVGDFLWFDAKDVGVNSQFADAIYHMRLPVDSSVIKKFKVPPFTEDKFSCWVADVALKVRLLEVRPGDSDEAGNYLKKYDLLSVGDYRPCETR